MSATTAATTAAATTAGAVGGAAVTATTYAVAQAATTAVLPTFMSWTGVVVAGTGTLHGPATAALASFAATPVGAPVLVTGAVLCSAVLGIWSLTRQ